MRHSIRFKLTLLLVILTGTILLICWFVNNTFLESFYQSSKKTDLIHMYQKVNIMLSVNSQEEETESDNTAFRLSDSEITFLQQACEKKGISMFVADSTGNIVFGYGMIDGRLQKRLLEIGVLEYFQEDDVLESGENYVLLNTYDEKVRSNYLEMAGLLDSGDYIIIRMAIESFSESIAISNRFLAYVGVMALFIGMLVMLLVSQRFTKPILELAHISERMSQLDFDVKYSGNKKDEIGVLGNSMNQLSRQLEKNISELKSANIQLQKDIDKRIQADEMRKDFISNVSHELKTPIALIQGYAEGLKESVNEDEESREFYCEVIMDEANKMNQMVRNLLTLNQIEFGDQMVTMERFDIVEVIDGVLNKMAILIQQNDIQVYFNEKEHYEVWADEFQTEQVITNYISNAIHHCALDKKIRIYVEKQESDVRISVFNTGAAIPEEDMDKIWQKFYKVDKARTREYGGNGIGLSIVKAIMNSFGKPFGVSNVEGGVLFWFELEGKPLVIKD